MASTAAEPDPRTDEHAIVDAVACGGGRRSRGRGELVLLLSRDEGADARAGLAGPARRLRVPAPVQLELVSGREGPPPEVVWASLPERAREAVLVLLARLIGSGAVEEECES